MRLCVLLEVSNRTTISSLDDMMKALKSRKPIAFMAQEALSQLILKGGAKAVFQQTDEYANAIIFFKRWRDSTLRKMFVARSEYFQYLYRDGQEELFDPSSEDDARDSSTDDYDE